MTNAHDNTASKLRASDGASLGTFGVEKFPVGVAFDGVYIWVANENGGIISKL